jgi:hypothetical protein
MKPSERWLLAVTLVIIDWIIFAIPLTGLLTAYIVLIRPAWFRQWVDQLYTDER